MLSFTSDTFFSYFLLSHLSWQTRKSHVARIQSCSGSLFLFQSLSFSLSLSLSLPLHLCTLVRTGEVTLSREPRESRRNLDQRKTRKISVNTGLRTLHLCFARICRRALVCGLIACGGCGSCGNGAGLIFNVSRCDARAGPTATAALPSDCSVK